MQYQVALGIYLQGNVAICFPDGLEDHSDRAGVGTWGDDEIVFHLLMVSVVDEIHPGIHVAVLDPAVGGDVGVPGSGMFANEVVALSGQRFQSDYLRAGIGSQESHTQALGNRISLRSIFHLCLRLV